MVLEKFLEDVLLNFLHPHHTICMLTKRNIISLYTQVMLVILNSLFKSRLPTLWFQFHARLFWSPPCSSAFISTSSICMLTITLYSQRSLKSVTREDFIRIKELCEESIEVSHLQGVSFDWSSPKKLSEPANLQQKVKV